MTPETQQHLVGLVRRQRAKMEALEQLELESIRRIGSINMRLLFTAAAGRLPPNVVDDVQKALDPDAIPLRPSDGNDQGNAGPG